ncbi:MAG: DUF202 domain-containing protein [Myxococcota bacterium]|nr:DUF202 domain-containing protein [Myxococcota bacterium]
MIRNYRDHAANERTFLAWVRTALALMGFGLLVERFDLLVNALSSSPDPTLSTGSDIAGTFLILLGVLVLAISSSRYVRFKRYIGSDEARDFDAARGDVALLFIVGTIGLLMALYVVRQLVA